MEHKERDIQIACFTWFRMQYHHLAGLFFAIPNGGHRNVREAVNLKRQGVLAGVADTFLAVPRTFTTDEWPFGDETTVHGLWIEFKVGSGKQTEAQIKFQKEVENQGYSYAISRDVNDFIALINGYLK